MPSVAIALAAIACMSLGYWVDSRRTPAPTRCERMQRAADSTRTALIARGLVADSEAPHLTFHCVRPHG